GGAELLLVEQLEALAATGLQADARAGESDARLRDLALLDGERGAVVAQLVGDALLVERARDLARLGGIEAGRQHRVGRGAGDAEQQEGDREDRHRRHSDDALGAGGEGAEGFDERGHGSAQTWVWKM